MTKIDNATGKPTSLSAGPLFQYGIANAFINGVYEGKLTTADLKREGDFGLGAPNLIDGELTVIDGRAYQTTADGTTREAPDTLKTPFAFVSTFRADTVASLLNIKSLDELFLKLQALLANKSTIYAVRITGMFSQIETRAFSPVSSKPFKPLTQLLAKQHLFQYDQMYGTMVGFYMPPYLSGLNIVGLHFHYLSADRKKGGHVVNLRADHLKVELSEINGFHLHIPDTEDFRSFGFSSGNSHDLNVIEKGKN